MNPSVLQSPAVQSVLASLWQRADANDPPLLTSALQEAERQGGLRSELPIQHLLREAFMAVDAPTARLLYVLARTRRPRLAVEFGTSYGISTLHLASALLDNGQGKLLTTELEPEKVKRARQSFADAGVASAVEVLEGDALQTLKRVQEPVDLVFLDGWKALYLPVLKLLEPRLSRGALIVADDLNILPEAMAPFLAHVRDAASGYVSVTLPIGDGLEVSTYLGGD